MMPDHAPPVFGWVGRFVVCGVSSSGPLTEVAWEYAHMNIVDFLNAESTRTLDLVAVTLGERWTE